MKKKLCACFLAVVMLCTCLPAQAFAASGVPEGYTPVYTLEDIYKATDRSSAVKLFLMNDIDADKEDVGEIMKGAFTYGSSELITQFRKGSVFDGNGHTIYHMKHLLTGNNYGTIRNLNVSMHDTPDDKKHLFYTDSARFQDRIAGICATNSGTIEGCNVRMTLDATSSIRTTIGGIAATNYGTIRDCIALFDVDYTTSNIMAFGGVCAESIGYITSEAEKKIDHCLALGRVNLSFNDSSKVSTIAGLTHLSNFDDHQIANSACALETLSAKNAQSEFNLNAGFTKFTTTKAPATNCRAANDMKIRWIDHGTISVQDGTIDSANDCTLDSRANILKDWDLSGIPAEEPSGGTTPTPAPTPEPTPEPEPEPETNPFPEGTANFYYSASNGKTRQHYFYYNDLMFYSFDETYRYQPLLATASLCLALSAFSNQENLAWDSTLSAQDHRRAFNVERLYETLGYTNAQYVNYDTALTDTSDKVAFSMAMKHIDDGEGHTDTVIAVPLRGGGYGGEWGSNFNLTMQNYYGNHVGFQRAANGVKSALADYLTKLKAEGKLKGEVKFWFTGYSRASATANLAAHDVSALSSLGGVPISRKNVYAYTFATPAGAKISAPDKDDNIFNIVSPVDLVPRVAPEAWGYGRYGTTLVLPYGNDQKLMDTYRSLSGLTKSQGDLAVMPAQRVLLDGFCADLTAAVPNAMAYLELGLNDALPKQLGSLLGGKPDNGYYGLDAVIDGVISLPDSVGGTLKKLLSNGLNSSGVARAHHPELYLARLETGGLNTVEDFASHARSKQVVVPLLKTIPGVTGGSASGHLGIFIYDSKDQLAGSYEDGVCKSGTATVEQTDAGVVFTLPDGDEEYTLSVGSRSDGKFSFSVFSYDEESLSEPARTVDFTDFPMEAGTVFAYTIPAGTDGEYRGYSEDGTDQYDPDYDSLTDGDDRPLDGGVSMNFTDVPAGAYFYDAVKWAVEEEITSGTSAVSFSPYAACTRAQVITFLWRAAGCPEPESGANPFVDVPSNAYYRDAVQWAVEEGITSGTSPSRFSPNATVTRDQTVTFLWRWDGCPDAETRSGFRDVPAGAYYADAVSWAVEREITKGTSAATFSPSQTCTRAQIVTFLYRDLCA